ncbi:NRAMP family divalent metal transporter [Cesiribacter andamanensis]|uniref:Mn2+ and Fe2+ transporters of the NRAMP family protein n=1 Tax=Cesiribacter andamanensis AMV16 TaxID=1279009 RepID=M7NSJ8_9BACT|nr:divalent metal cation transporter [Cesiribacter andamanensis]EMR04665.1 Mn2+ and Fe2+ transporters of the NRAMP family protein [Cesiribacter andamanensis AMV16]
MPVKELDSAPLRTGLPLWQLLQRVVGPGILFASCAIGVSHLVQSTRAGALYGFDLALFIILANVLKFPFFEYGTRYACATGRSILWGYRQRGRWMLLLYLVLTGVSMFSVASAVTFVCAGLFGNLLGLAAAATPWVAGGILLVCVLLLAADKFSLLDGSLKILALVLLITTLTAFFALMWDWASGQLPERRLDLSNTDIFAAGSLPFIIALMGWMPTAVDLSAWNSIWTVEKIRQTGYHPTLKESLFDFNLGYWFSAGLALCFLSLGALVMWGSGTPLSDSSVGFAAQLISLYTAAIGDWIYYIIAIAAATVMFSTVITVLDGYSRALDETLLLLSPRFLRKRSGQRLYTPILLLVAGGSFMIISLLATGLAALVDFATILSFIIAPFIALINYRVILGKEVARAHQPGRGMRILSWLGIIFLSGFTLVYGYYLLVLA